MKTNCSLFIIKSLSLFLITIFLVSCEKEVDPKLLPVLTTTEIVRITEATAYSGGNITSDAGSEITTRGVCWSESPNPTIEDKKTTDAAGTGVFESRIVGLNPSTTYYLRAYAVNKKGVAYGLQVVVKTKTLTITTTPITAATISSAVSGGTLETDGDSLNVSERGICWSTSANPTIANSKIANGKGKGKYTASITGLQIATQYYVRAYATNITSTFYGDEIKLITTNGSMTLTTTIATSITAVSATIGGTVPNDGGAAVTERGFCISKLPNPTINNKITNGSGVGSFASNITGLEANTTYYVRVFATNIVGTAYGNEISFTTKDGIVTLTTTTAFSITTTSATSGGTITNDGGATITARGICWSTSTKPTIANSKSTSIGTIGSFTINFSNLNTGTTYYLRAYATNATGTTYGNEINFSTLATFQDIDGNTYGYITIGTQTWMVENLKTTKYNDGTAIPNITINSTWRAPGAYCWYNNDIANKATYGALYNWYAVNTGKLAPSGWHVATDAEWTILENYVSANLGISYTAGKALAAITYWTPSTSWVAIGNELTNNNSSGFSALPSGNRRNYGTFDSLGSVGNWWTATEFDASGAWYRSMSYNSINVFRTNAYKEYGYSVRCVRD